MTCTAKYVGKDNPIGLVHDSEYRISWIEMINCLDLWIWDDSIITGSGNAISPWSIDRSLPTDTTSCGLQRAINTYYLSVDNFLGDWELMPKVVAHLLGMNL